MLGGTPLSPRIRSLEHPLRDPFAVLFFFAFGLVIDLGDVFSMAGVEACLET